MAIYTECMIEAVPRKEIKRTNRRNRRKKPPWWNDKVSESKQELNKAKKIIRWIRIVSYCLFEDRGN